MLLFGSEGFATEGLKVSICGFSIAQYVPASIAERIRMKFDIGDCHKNFVGVLQFPVKSDRNLDRVHEVVPALPCERARVARYAF
jgi:hypothetical protein